MTIQRKTKVFINDIDTHIGNAEYRAGTLSGYVQVTLHDPDDDNTSSIHEFHITTTRPNTDVLNYWAAGYIGRSESYKQYYSSEFQNVKVKRGNIIKRINNDTGKKVVACWIAAYDSKVLAFEIHYPNGTIYQTSEVYLTTNIHQQRQTEMLPCLKIDKYDSYIEMSQPVVKSTHRRTGSKLSLCDEARVLDLLQQQVKQKHIASTFNVSAAYITKLKAQFIKNGQL